MAHSHSILDMDAIFSIDAITRQITNETPKRKLTIVQHDHNSERFTFTLPRTIEGHDMTLCNRVEVHYINIEDKTKKEATGLYVVDDLEVSADDEKKAVCSWLISRNATGYAGKLAFLLRFMCLTTGGDETIIDYAWHTAPYSDIYVTAGIDASEVFETEYVEIIDRWKASVMAHFTGAIGEELTAWEEKTGAEVRAEAFADIDKQRERIDLLSNYVTPEMFGAKGDGVTDDTEAIQNCINENSIIFFDNKTYIVSGIEIPADKIVYFANTTIKKIDQSIVPAVKITGSNVSVLGTPIIIGTRFDDKTEFCHCMSIVNNTEPIGDIYIESLQAENAQGDGLYIGSSSHNLHNIKVGRVVSKNCFRHGLSITSGQDVIIESVSCENGGVDFEPYGADVVMRNVVIRNVAAAFLSVVPQANLAYNIQFGNVILTNAPDVALTVHSCDDIKFDKLTIVASGTRAILFDIHHAALTRLCEIDTLCIKDAFTTYAEGVQDAAYVVPNGIERLIVNYADVHGDLDHPIDLFLGNGNDKPEVVVNGGNITAYRVGRYITAKLLNCAMKCVSCLMGGYDNSLVRDCVIDCQTLFSYANIKALAHDNIIEAATLQNNAVWKLYNNLINGEFTA